MTPVQMLQRPADPASAPPTVVGAVGVSALRVPDDMTVEVALSVMASAQVGYLLVCDKDEQCTSSITRAQLSVVRDSCAYTDRIRLRDILGAGGPSTSPATMTVGDGPATRHRQPSALPIVTGVHGRALGVLTLSP
ncbi:hypothetical protein ABT063_31445 [Streptomyces sp. NPDC002838]|uniref:hypothetical protein n=1 Tax=Streptomyces sp. NPDC002838 TaxID=3154436 RepID=UPI003321126D